MSYHISRFVDCGFDEALERATAALAAHGFGVLTEIDARATLKQKLDMDFRPYRILGACNPSLAYKALCAEDKIGTMLPCNVIVQEIEPGRSEVAAIDPLMSMQAVRNPELADTAKDVQEKLARVIERL